MIKTAAFLALALAACEIPAGPNELATETSALNGQSAQLAGMHDAEASTFMRGWTTSADKGWITDLQYIGSNGSPTVNCHTTETNAGVSIIQRLDVDGGASFPTGDPTGYANSFATFVNTCPAIHVWIVGNEPNVTTGQSDPAFWASSYAAAYIAARNRVHAINGHQSDLVLASPASPYSPFCICSMHRIIQQIVAQGGQPDGFAVHAYTQEPNGSSAMTGLVASEEMNGSNDGCNLPFHRQFRIYRDWIGAMEANGQGGKPVFLTEVGNVCANGPGHACYPDANNGYFQAMYQEIRTWNAGHNTKVRALTPYRWTINDDGSGRDFSIASRPQLQADLVAAFNAGGPPPPPSTCDNGVPLNGTACNPGDPNAQFVCTSPGAGPTAQWTRQQCTGGQTCSGNQCQGGVPPATCDNGVPINGTACNPSDPFAQYLCTSPGAGPTAQWTRQTCSSGQSCSDGRCQGGLPQCGFGRFCASNQLPGSSACLAGAQTIFCCAPGHTIANGVCT